MRWESPYQNVLAGDLQQSSIHVGTVLLTLFPCHVVPEESIATVSIISPVCVTWAAFMVLRETKDRTPFILNQACFSAIVNVSRRSHDPLQIAAQKYSWDRGDEEVTKPYLLKLPFFSDCLIKSWQNFFANCCRVPERLSFSACR